MRSNCRFLTAMVVLLSIGLTAAAQQDVSDKFKPKWLRTLPAASNSSFSYVVVSASGSTLKEAQENCLADMLSAAGLEKGVTVKTNIKSSEAERVVWRDDDKSEYVESTFQANSTVEGKEVSLQGVKIDEYWVRRADGVIYLTTLYARSQLGREAKFDRIQLTEQYGVHGLWRSAIIPGWGQFYKGTNLKGGLILGGCAVLAAGIIFTESQRADYADKIVKTHNAENKRSYATKRDNFATGRNICIGAAAALYVYNLIDAIAAPGARRVAVGSKNSSRRYAIAPTVMNDGNVGMMACFTF